MAAGVARDQHDDPNVSYLLRGVKRIQAKLTEKMCASRPRCTDPFIHPCACSPAQALVPVHKPAG